MGPADPTGLIGHAGRQHPVGYHFAGRRVIVRLDRGLVRITARRVLLCSLPSPLSATKIARIHDAHRRTTAHPKFRTGTG
ncbi:hypothetical protein MED15_06210 [Micromonospora noduli]|uniref:Uncharacterized protein n=1 Tax=Micromonospora noduli TaxID=709876 RepID=A0ABX9CTW3_9ACTN|nr:hypothetical protein MED15_06210 [Micromonospora noduli]RAO10103.1 hypothetical protein LUPAC07_05315 [Micromonospora noduli]